MTGTTRRRPAATYVYYQCPHDRNNPRHAAAVPDHPSGVRVSEDQLTAAIRQFLAERIFGPERARLLAAALPANAESDTARRDRQAAALTKRLRQIDAAENAHAREIEALTDIDAAAPAITALRTRIVARFTELETERAAINEQLQALAEPAASREDPALLDKLPQMPALAAQASPRIQHLLLDALGIQALYSHELHQVTLRATITTSTPAIVAAIISDSHQPKPGTVSPLSQHPLVLPAGHS